MPRNKGMRDLHNCKRNDKGVRQGERSDLIPSLVSHLSLPSKPETPD